MTTQTARDLSRQRPFEHIVTELADNLPLLALRPRIENRRSDDGVLVEVMCRSTVVELQRLARELDGRTPTILDAWPHPEHSGS